MKIKRLFWDQVYFECQYAGYCLALGYLVMSNGKKIICEEKKTNRLKFGIFKGNGVISPVCVIEIMETLKWDTGLALREYLDTGAFLNDNFKNEPYKYEDYMAADFAKGGMLNKDNVDPTRALLREIIEERYVSCFMTNVPFDDASRLRKSDQDLEVPFSLNVASATKYPERLPFSADELNSNSNAPADPGIYAVTLVNQ